MTDKTATTTIPAGSITVGMVTAGAEEVANYYDDGNDLRHREVARFVFQAMLRAAPSPAPAAPSAAQWMPIETAPKDGTRVLTATIHGGGYPAVSWWAKLDMIDHEHGTHAWCWTGTHVPWGHQPTHWMPLPPDPSPHPQPTEPGEFEQVLREMDGAARGEDADPEFDEEQMALIADWHGRLLKGLPVATQSGGSAVPDEAWVGSGASVATDEDMRSALEGMTRHIKYSSGEFGELSAELLTTVDGVHWSVAARKMRRALSAARASAPEVVEALKFYANREHMVGDWAGWEDASGEPSNWLNAPDGHGSMIEDGGVARGALAKIEGSSRHD